MAKKRSKNVLRFRASSKFIDEWERYVKAYEAKRREAKAGSRLMRQAIIEFMDNHPNSGAPIRRDL